MKWLLTVLKQLKQKDKVLLICANKNRAQEIHNCLSENDVSSTLFHEQLSLIERDQQAALFASNPKIKILVSSEIGSGNL